MKKSKIIGLSLGFSALAAVAISTPFIVTSCSSESSVEKLTGKIEDGAVTATVGGNAIDSTNIVGGENSITVYTNKTAGSVVVTLKNNLADIFKGETGMTGTPTVTWTMASAKDVEFDSKNNTVTASVADENTSITVNLTAKIEGDKAAQTTKEGDADATTPAAEKITKELNIKLIITGAAKA